MKERLFNLVDSFSLSNENDASPKTTDTRSRQPFGYNEDEDTERIEKEDVDRYWKIYEKNPVIRETINSFASRVVEDGYYIEAPNDEVAEKIGDWIEKSAILEGEFDQEFNRFIKKSIIQREVKGTVLIEKVKNNEGDKLVAFKFVPVGGLEIHTKPNQSILVPPEPKDNSKEDFEAPETSDGKLASYEQVTDVEGFSNNAEVVLFTRDEVIKITRDADIGEVKGTSRVQAVADRAEGLHRKLEDNDEAISTKAYPLWLFKFGSEDNPWDSDKIEEFMSSHEMDNFHPGMKQGVYGDIDVETVSGEVSDIAEYLQFDVDFIMSAMPMPKYTVGFEQSVNQFVSNQQKSNLKRQIREARNEIEDEFTPVLRDKAKELNESGEINVSEDEIKDINLRIGKPDTEDIEEENINVIRYLGVDKDQRGAGEKKKKGQDGTPNNLPNADSSDDEEGETEDSQNIEENSLWSKDTHGSFELESSNEERLSEALNDVLMEAKQDMVDSISSDVKRRVGYSDTSASVYREYSNSRRVKRQAKQIVKDTIDSVILEQESRYGNPSGMQNVNHYTSNIVESYNSVLDDLLDETRIQLRRGAECGEEIEDILDRVDEKFNESKVTQVSQTIAQMEIKNIRENIKLEQYENNPEIIGYRFVNEDPQTDLSSQVNGVEVYFDEEDTYVEQIMSSLGDSIQLRKGFDPIPCTPPIKHGDTTTIEPIREE